MAEYPKGDAMERYRAAGQGTIPNYTPNPPKPLIRPVLEDFCLHMEEKLKKNDHKRGWRELPIEALQRLLMLELEEYKVARDFFGPAAARKELVDVANFCMMLWDRLDSEDKENPYAK